MRNTVLTLLNGPQLRKFYAADQWQDDTIYALAAKNAQANPDRVAIRENSRTVSYAELIDAADRLAAKFHACGILAGERIAVWLPSRAETVVALLACSRNGYVCCPSLHRTHTVDEISTLVQRMGAVAVIAEKGYGVGSETDDVITTVKNAQVALKFSLLLDPVKGSGRGILGALESIAPNTVDSAQPNPDGVVYLAFTSGTTGQPKGVMHSDNTLLAPARALARDWSLDATAVIYTLSPLSHNLGFGAMILATSHGGELVLHDLARGTSLVDRLIEVGATFLFGVPTHAIDLIAELKARRFATLGEVRGFRVSGAPMPPVVAQGLIDLGITPQSGFGMTEAGSHQYTLPHDDLELIIGSCGHSYDGYEVRIFSRDDTDEQLPPHEIGQVGGRGSSLMLGYFDDQSATESSFNADGWFMTGDLGWVDGAGYLRITGRQKEIIIRGGHNIFPASIENLAMQHEFINKAAAVPIPDERLGEKVCLVYSGKNGTQLDAAQILAHLKNAGLSKYDLPEYLIQMDHLPIGPSGKISKKKILDLLANGSISPHAVGHQGS